MEVASFTEIMVVFGSVGLALGLGVGGPVFAFMYLWKRVNT